MEVTKTNFKDVLNKLPEVFNSAQFITFDTEFTGLKVEGASPLNYFDTLEDIYTKDRLKAETFMVIQYGIVTFHYDEKLDRYTHQAFNFYVYPSSLCSNTNFTCQASSLQFLAKHGFNFNKLISEGIPYLRDVEVEELLEKLEEKYEKKSKYDKMLRSDAVIPKEHKSTIDGINKKIEDFLKSGNGDGISLGTHNSFIRRLIYSSIQEKFGTQVFLQTNKDQSMTASLARTAQELEEKQKELFQGEKQEILDDVGFSKVIKLIMESRKLFIGHNLCLDLLFTINQFVQPLPNTYKQFKELAHFLFPKIIDTKFMASTSDFKNIKQTTLDELLTHFQNSNSVPEVDIYQDGVGYKLSEDKFHEAAYDAYITGLCFLAMSRQIGNLNLTNIFKTLNVSPFIEPFLNKVCIPRLHEIPFMNIGGHDAEPSRLNVFHLTFPKEWKRDDVFKLFKDYGFINMSWINDTSAFVIVKKEQTKKVCKNLIKPNKCYILQTYEQFHTLQASRRNETEEIELSSDSSAGSKSTSNSSSSLSSSASSNGERKRTQKEDRGEVISRPQKKICSFETPPFD